MGGARNIPRSARSAYKRKLSDYERLRWLLIKSRFPGFTEEVERAFWYIVSELGLKPEDSEFTEELLNLIQVPLDVLDRTNKTKHTSPTMDANLLSEWLKAVYDCNCLLESSVSKNVNPLTALYVGEEDSVALLSAFDKIKQLEDEISRYKTKLDTIEEDVDGYHQNIQYHYIE